MESWNVRLALECRGVIGTQRDQLACWYVHLRVETFHLGNWCNWPERFRSRLEFALSRRSPPARVSRLAQLPITSTVSANPFFIAGCQSFVRNSVRGNEVMRTSALKRLDLAHLKIL